MADHKEYWVTAGDQGTIKISEDVVASIAAFAATETEGVGGLFAGLTTEIASFLGKKTQSKGVKVQIGERNTVSVDISILVQFGKSVGEVALAVQQAAKTSIESMTGLKTAAVNVIVGGVSFEPPQPQTEDFLAPAES
nr:Asp23/Gls24 family envelope stress response protein [uncultured Butyricicoccus sp.]